MRTLICALSFALSASAAAQEKDKWRRVYTFEDSVIEMNTSKVTFGEDGIGRVRFRTVLSKPEALREAPGVKYKSRLETIEFKCTQRRFRVYEVTLLDPKGKPIRSREVEMSDEWKAVKSGSTMQSLFASACELIGEKRRNP